MSNFCGNNKLLVVFRHNPYSMVDGKTVLYCDKWEDYYYYLDRSSGRPVMKTILKRVPTARKRNISVRKGKEASRI